MCGSILLVLHLHSHDGAREVSLLSVLGGLWGQQVWRQRRVQGVCEQNKLELDLQGTEQWYGQNKTYYNINLRESLNNSNMADLLLELHTDGVGLLQEDGVPPQQVPQRRELVTAPLPEAPHSQLSLPLRPLHCG